MPKKARKKSIELLILEVLNKRMDLSVKDKQHYLNLKRGFEGEKLFDSVTERLQCDRIILNDLMLKVNNTIFQIDTLILMSHTIYIFEVKNYKGDYFFEAEKFFKSPDYEIVNPLHQLSRSESLLHQLFLKYGINLPIESFVVFINPEFTLYQAPFNKPIIFPSQIKSHFNQLNKKSSKLNKRHNFFADKLISLHIEKSPYTQIPDYFYNQLKKGITCLKCNAYSISIKGTTSICEDCGHKETVASSVLRSVEEFKLLFPEQRITTNNIHEWCQVITDKKRIRRIIEKNYTKVGSNRWIYFE